MAKKSVEAVLKMPVLPSEIKINTPENWGWARLIQLYNFIDYRGKTPNKIETGVPLVTAKNIRMGYLDYTIADFISREEYEQRQSRGISRRGDILFTTEAPMGNVAIADLDEYSAGQRVITFQKRPEIEWVSDQFYFYYIMSCYFQDELQHNKTGNTVEGIKAEKLMRFPVPVPPLAEQQRIVDCIEYLFAKLDEAKEKAQSVLDSFETRKAAILHKAFTGELTAKWRSVHEKGLNEWTSSYLKECCQIGSGGTPSRKNPEYYEGSIPWIKTGEINWNEIDDAEEKISDAAIENSSAKLYDLGAVLVAMYGMGVTRGRAAILQVPAATNQAVCVLQPADYLLNKYLFYYFMCNYWDIREQAVGGNQLNLSGTIIGKFQISIPSLDEQTEIVRILDSLFAKEQQAKEAAEAVLEKIDLLKKSILARAFRGELGTNDPTEESALELLKAVIC